MRDVCIDTGFLIGLYQTKHDFHAKAQEYFDRFFAEGGNRMLVPWPVVYETFSSRTVRNHDALNVLSSDWKRLRYRGQLHLLDDLPFRRRVIDDCFDELTKPTRIRKNLSAADRIIRGILSDQNLKIGALITFNPQDFLDVCQRFRRQVFGPV